MDPPESEKLVNGRDLYENWCNGNDGNDDESGTEPEPEPHRAPLYDQPVPKDESLFRKMRRMVVIEPYYMLFTVGGYPSMSLREQYFYYAVGMSMGIDTNNLTSSENQTCGTDLNDTAYEQREQVQARSAELTMYIELAVFLPSVISMLLYGAYSDKLGRRLLFILPPIGACVDVALQMCIIHFKLPVWVFYLSTIGSIVCGSSSLVFIAIYSYIADTVAPQGRATRMIIIDVIGRLLGGFVQLGIGYWIKRSYFWPYCFVGGCYLLAIIYAVFLIPETVQRDPLATFKFSDIWRAFKLYTTDNGTNRRWKLWVLTMSLMVECLFLAFGIMTLFEMNAPLCWNSVMIGYYGAARATVEAIGGIVGVFFKLCMEDHWLALLGKLTFTAEMLYMAFVKTTLMMYFVPLISFFGILSMPALRTMMSNLVDLDEQGALFSMMHCMLAFVFLFSGTMMKKIYSVTLYWWSGFVFMLSSIGAFLATLMLVYYIVRLKRERKRLNTQLLVNEDKEDCSVEPEDT